jgi:hypothetical protein
MHVSKKIISLSLILFQLGYIFFFSVSPVSAGSTFQTAYITLGNSRYSFVGAVSGNVTAGSATLVISSSGYPDNNMGNLFPEDTICFSGAPATPGNGCKNSMDPTNANGNYVATNSPSLTGQTIFFTPAMGGVVNTGDQVISTQSGQLTISFKPTTALVSGDKLVLTLPAAVANYANGIPDSAGFDSAALPANMIAGTCAANACFNPTGFTASAVALTSATTAHTVTITVSSSLDTATVYTFTLGHASNATLRFLNPAPSGVSHVRGISDSLGAELKSQNSGQTLTYDDTLLKVNPIDGVLVSANVEEALTYKINEANQGYVNVSGTIPAGTAVTECNGGTFTTTTGVTSTPTSVNFGSITSYGAFYRAAQEIYIQTNSANGYTVTAQYNNPLQTAGGLRTIANGTCDGGCTNIINAAWGTAGNYGFGYTLGNKTGTDAPFTGTTFKIFGTTPQQVMARSSATTGAGSRVEICYQLSVASTQSTGYYFNKITYIATPKF